jgi:hypothetical protein
LVWGAWAHIQQLTSLFSDIKPLLNISLSTICYYVISWAHTLVTCLQDLRKTIRTSVSMGGVLAVIQTEHILNTTVIVMPTR